MMTNAVKLNHESRLDAKEINNVTTDWTLSSKVNTELVSSQVRPQPSFVLRRVTTECTGTFKGSGVVVENELLFACPHFTRGLPVESDRLSPWVSVELLFRESTSLPSQGRAMEWSSTQVRLWIRFSISTSPPPSYSFRRAGCQAVQKVSSHSVIMHPSSILPLKKGRRYWCGMTGPVISQLFEQP